MNAWTDFWGGVSVLQLAAWVVGLCAVFIFIYKSWPILTRFVTTINSLADLPRFMVTTAATLAAQDVKIEEIHHEVHYNNGSSVKDAIGRVEKGVAGLYTRADAADAADAAMRKELEDTRPHTPARKRPAKPKEQ